MEPRSASEVATAVETFREHIARAERTGIGGAILLAVCRGRRRVALASAPKRTPGESGGVDSPETTPGKDPPQQSATPSPKSTPGNPRLSEGVDFSDSACRAVVITGLPLPPAYDAKVPPRAPTSSHNLPDILHLP